jgi:tetratricopeptide (TPR) repeat protein
MAWAGVCRECSAPCGNFHDSKRDLNASSMPMKSGISKFAIIAALVLLAGMAFAQNQPAQSGQSPQQQQQTNPAPDPNESSSRKTPPPNEASAPGSQESSSRKTPSPDSDSEPEPKEKSKDKSANYDPFPAVKDVEIGEFYLHKGDLDAAISRFEEAIQLRPNYAQPRLLLAQVYEKKGEKDQAVKYYKEYLQVFPHAPDAKKIEKKIEKLSQ